ALDPNLHLLQPELGGPLGGHLGGPLGGEGRALAAALEADRPRRGVAQGVAVGVGDGHDGVVERRLDVGNAPADVAPLLALLALRHGGPFPQGKRQAWARPRTPGSRSTPCHAATFSAGTARRPFPTGWLLVLDALLPRDRLARALAGPGVGPRPL